MYINYNDYTEIYDPMDEKLFNRLAFEASRFLDRMTTGVDGVKKLKTAFPTDEESATCVKHCAANLVNLLYQIQKVEEETYQSRGYIPTENGLQGKVISTITSGNESISFSAANPKTQIDAAISDITARNKIMREVVREYLSGIADANGINLLYMGPYHW